MENNESYILSLEDKIESLTDENLQLKDKIRFSKEDELLEFIKTFYDSVIDEIDYVESKLTKKEMLDSMKKNIEEFSRIYKINLK
jgi:tRNA A37 threonylcarbamoyladenosine dehydratase